MCTEKAVEERVCSHNALHKEEQSVGEPLGHDNGTWHETLAPTCTANGSRELRCNRDNEVLETSVITAIGHDWEWVVTTPATATSVGVETQRCKNNPSHTNGTRPLLPKCNGVEYDPRDGKFQDCRDNKFYKYVGINGQVWMAENLNFKADGSRCYDDDTGGDSEGNCEIYGRLYNWNTAMGGAESSTTNPSGVQGVCPSGWHIPSEAEWAELVIFAGGIGEYFEDGPAGTKLKATSGWKSGGIPGTDDFGFSALPGGCSYNNGYSFDGVITNGQWWSSSGDWYVYTLGIYYGNEFLSLNPSGDKSVLYSVRCLRD
jgi:uncharacterized protein (TIGR02145 family)